MNLISNQSTTEDLRFTSHYYCETDFFSFSQKNTYNTKLFGNFYVHEINTAPQI